jgi:hypothetical protein
MIGNCIDEAINDVRKLHSKGNSLITYLIIYEGLMKSRYLLILGIALTLLVASCTTGTPTPTSTPDEVTEPTAVPTEAKVMDEDAIYLNLVWHQHQPLYYKDENGVYTRPWARAHATKDYYDMAALLRNFPGVHATFNLTPVLIRQLDDLASGAKDYYRVLSEIPAGELTDDQKRFILTRFFDANWDHVITRIPRYVELLDKRGRTADTETIEAALNTFSEQDFRDLQLKKGKILMVVTKRSSSK